MTTTARRALSLGTLSVTFLRRLPHPFRLAARVSLGAVTTAATLVACGGGGNPLDNAETVSNPATTGGRKLSFLYYQYCVNPIFDLALPVQIGGATTINTCGSSGCHDNTNGTGGAFRVIQNATPFTYPPSGSPSPETVRATDIYRNFYSAQGEVIIGSPEQSRLLNKPLVRNMLHGGGLIFASDLDPNVQRIRFWLERPMPEGQDEFSPVPGMFAGGVASSANCLSN
jgi:hypothetical protein